MVNVLNNKIKYKSVTVSDWKVMKITYTNNYVSVMCCCTTFHHSRNNATSKLIIYIHKISILKSL